MSISDIPAVTPPAKPDDLPDYLPDDLRQLTQARIALGRAGSGVPTAAALRFSLDHARAREAVWTGLDHQSFQQDLARQGTESLIIDSAADSRATYVRRPDLGRLLAPGARELLQARAQAEGTACDLAIVVADGLSATAITLNAQGMIAALLARAQKFGWRIAPVVIARQARVAIGDPIGETVRAKCTAVLVGERPGLSAADSLGCYLTFDPKPGLPDSRRNCISNIRQGGLSITAAADQAASLIRAMRQQGVSGVDLVRELLIEGERLLIATEM